MVHPVSQYMRIKRHTMHGNQTTYPRTRKLRWILGSYLDKKQKTSYTHHMVQYLRTPLLPIPNLFQSWHEPILHTTLRLQCTILPRHEPPMEKIRWQVTNKMIWMEHCLKPLTILTSRIHGPLQHHALRKKIPWINRDPAPLLLISPECITDNKGIHPMWITMTIEISFKTLYRRKDKNNLNRYYPVDLLYPVMQSLPFYLGDLTGDTDG